MAIIQISKIQQRSGNIVDLPQLDEAEFGWATDVKRLYIGKTTPNENIEVLTSYSNISFSQINGSYGNLNIDSANIANGQPLVYTGSEWTNRGGNVGGLINLGDVSNVKIDGGAISYVLETDGTGNLSWGPKSTIVAFIETISTASTAVVTTVGDNYFVNGAIITITNVPETDLSPSNPVSGLLNGNSYYVKVLTSSTFELYTDSLLSTPVDTSTYDPYAYAEVTDTTAGTNRITLLNAGDSDLFTIDEPVVFTGTTFGGITAGVTYYVLSKPTSSTITISETVGGNVVELLTDSGTCFVYGSGGRAVSLVSSTGGSTGTAAGTNTMVQFNNTNVLDGSPNYTFDFANNIMYLNGNANVGNLNATGTILSPTFISNVSTGTAPLTVTSTTRVANLNVSHSNVSDFGAVTLQTTGTYFPTFVSSSASGNRALGANANLAFDAATGNLQTNIFYANTSVLSAANITGNVITGNTTVIGSNLIASNSIFSTRFIQSPYQIVAPTSIVNRGTGVLSTTSTSIATESNPHNVAVDPTGRFVYVTNLSSNTIGQYIINQTTGALSTIATATTSGGVSPYGITVDPTGRFVYVANFTSSTIGQYIINQTTGALSSITTAIASGTNPYLITVDPTGRFVYVANTTSNTISQYSINQTTGALTSITTAIASGTSPHGIIVDPTGRFVYVTNYSSGTVSQYSINQTTGALSTITTAIATGSTPWVIAVDPTGRFVYVTNYSSNTISQYSINQTTGALSTITTAIASGSTPWGITIDSTGRFVYVVNSGSNTISQYSINQITGALTSVATVSNTSGTTPYAIATDPTGRFAYIVNNVTQNIGQYNINNFLAGTSTITGNNSSTSSSTGALVVSGGVGVSGNIYSGANIFATGIVSATDSIFTSKFSQSPYQIVAPRGIVNQGTGALSVITTAIASGTSPISVAVDPTGRFVYVANFGASTVSQYSINQTNGALTSITTAIASGASPYSVAVDPTGRFVYVTNFGTNTVSQYSINQTTGALSTIATAIASGTSPISVAVDPTGRFVYVANFGASTVSQYSINQTTGVLTSITTAIASGASPYSVAVDPTGRFVYVANYSSNTVSQYSINQTTGALTSITTAIASGIQPFGIAVDPTGRFVYVTNFTGNSVSQYSINQTTGALTSITTAIASGTGPYSVAVDPTGKFVYVANYGASTVSQYSINQTTGALSTITTAIASGVSPWGITIDSTGRFVYVTNFTSSTVSQYSISNFSAGSMTIAGNITVSNTITGIITSLTTGSNTTAGSVTGNWTLTAGSRWNATYADLAEYYTSDMHYEPGTVLEFGGQYEVTLGTSQTNKVAGVVSTDPAFAMNAKCIGEHIVPIALQGRVPTKVTGNITKGDMMVSAGNGYATACSSPTIGTVVGKALENYNGTDGIIEIAVGRL